MEFRKIVWTPVGADVSRTAPMYRPSVGVPLSGLFCESPFSFTSANLWELHVLQR